MKPGPKPGKAREVVLLRLEPRVADALRLDKAKLGVRSLGDVVTEWSNLRQGRDEALRAVQAENARLTDMVAGYAAAAAEARRQAKRARVDAAKAGARRRAAAPVDLYAAAASTPCGAGCGFFMDPLGLAAGEARCLDCRRPAVAIEA